MNLHEQRLACRDAKSDNVGLLQNKVKLIDFGLLAELPEGERDNEYLTQRCGTLRGMSSDCCLGRYKEKVVWEVWYLQGGFLARCQGKNLDHVEAILAGTREEDGVLANLIVSGWNGNPEEPPTMAELSDALQNEVINYTTMTDENTTTDTTATASQQASHIHVVLV